MTISASARPSTSTVRLLLRRAGSPSRYDATASSSTSIGAAELGVVAATKYAGCMPLLIVISSGSPRASALS